MIAFLFPGQGAQAVGMGRELAAAYPIARQTFEEADAAFASVAGRPYREGRPEGRPSRGGGGADAEGGGAVAQRGRGAVIEDGRGEIVEADLQADQGSAVVEADLQVGLDQAGPRLSDLCFNGPEDELQLTEITQPAIVATSIAAYRVLAAHGLSPDFVAGHSLGEYSANVAAGTIDFGDAVAAVRRRGRYMQEAVPVGTGAMAAILGADLALVRQACEEAAGGDVVSPANINGPGQIVIAGVAAAVARAAARAKELGAKRVVPLAVSAPFHCALMAPAEARLAPELRALPAQAPRMPIVANVDAGLKRDASAAIEALVRQVSAPVRWEDVIRRLASAGVTTYVEVGPGTVLGRLVKKIHRDASVLHFGSPGELGAVVAACSISAEK